MVLLLLCVIALVLPATRVNSYQNLTLEHKSYRASRGLIFEGGGFNKMLFNLIHNVPLEDPVHWRDLLGIINLQTMYNVPTSPLFWWDIGENYARKSMESVRADFERTGKAAPDDSRVFVYEFLRSLMERRGVNGEECMKKSVCENAQIDHHEGLYAEILDAILTPGLVDDAYRDPYLAGKHGVDCGKLFAKCPYGDSIFDRITVDF